MDGLLTSKTTNTTDTDILGNTLKSADTTTYDPALRGIDPNKETVQGQLSGILAKGGDYIEKARADSAGVANSRGLLNSSIAAGAGESAAIGAALPIAQADAGIYGTASRDNQAATNTSLQSNASDLNTTAKFNADELNQIPKATAAGNIQSRLQGEAATQALTSQGMRGDQATALTQIQQQNQQLMTASSEASSLFTNIHNQIASVLADQATSPETKANLVDKFTQQLKTGFALIGGINNVDINGVLDWTPA